MAQDEIGHARSLYPLLKDLLGASPDVEPETRSDFTHAPFLSQPFESWTDFVAANFLLDTALTVLLEAARDSSFSPLAQRARRMLEEEQLHWLHAEGWTRRLTRTGDGVRRALATSLDAVDPDAAAWFDVATPELVESGVLAEGADTLRDRFRARTGSVLRAAGLDGDA
jgi:1,2-phenylacetyl-CoA epoxidase catalytic subunit